jgi:hypothetical protein
VQSYSIRCYAQEARRYKKAKVTTYPGRRAVADTVGDRMKAIRITIGGSLRNEISQEALGALVGWDKFKVSRLERGAQPLSRDDAIALAKVDPQNRGPSWLMFGEKDSDIEPFDQDDDEGGQGAPVNGNPPITIPPTVHRTVPKEVSRLEDEPPQKGKASKRPPRGRTALAS